MKVNSIKLFIFIVYVLMSLVLPQSIFANSRHPSTISTMTLDLSARYRNKGYFHLFQPAGMKCLRQESYSE